MALIEEDVLGAVAATAVVLSPRVRKVARKGAVYGIAGMLKAGDVVVAAARGAARSTPGTPVAGDEPTAESQRPVTRQPTPSKRSQQRPRGTTSS